MTQDTEQEDSSPDGASSAVEDDPRGFQNLLEFLRQNRGFDFGGYKPTSLARRILRRMQTVGVTSYDAYVEYLEVHADEFPQLFNTILINVTAFFRDAPAWDVLREHLQRIVAARPRGTTIRVWSACCASGEEAYSLAMLLAEILGPEQFALRAKIYATDIDGEALTQARLATYSAKAVEGVPPALLAKYFTATGASYVFSKELRRAVIFGRHDLLQDAPISRVDALACRNALMYFNAETQSRILGRLHFALAPDGILFLGKAEMLLTHGSLFTPLDLKMRLFARTSRAGVRERAPTFEATRKPAEAEVADLQARLLQASFDALPLAVVTLDALGRIMRVNQRASNLFGLTSSDTGRPFQDFELSYRPTELRSILDQVRQERRVVQVEGIERVTSGGEKSYMDLEVVPLLDGEALMGAELCFQDSTRFKRVQAELRNATVELEASHEELQSTSEELETTNEELQSTVEELETTNEELQSTNEELETMNEELQSTNSELQTMNEELTERGDALNHANAFLATVLASLRSGVAVLDRDLVVQAWNEPMSELWGLRPDEVVGRPFLTLEIGLPLEPLRGPLRDCISGNATPLDVELECTNRRGRTIRVRACVRPLKTAGDVGAVLLVEEA
jgi:two-component system CheB/CheR fusion protein